MGGDRYMRLVTQHSTGIHARTNTADPETAVQQLVFMVLDSGTPGTPLTEIYTALWQAWTCVFEGPTITLDHALLR